MSTTSIEWTDVTWNPVVGRTPVSEGCRNCYAARMARRLEAMGLPEYQPHNITDIVDGRPENVTTVLRRIAEVRGGRPVFTGDVRLVPDRLTEPLRWRKPRRVFVNSMSDLFHPDVPFEFIDRVFAVMAICPQHTFQILTKRPKRMAEYFINRTWSDVISGISAEAQSERVGAVTATSQIASRLVYLDRIGTVEFVERHFSDQKSRTPQKLIPDAWPLPNVWLGTSVENQATADERIPHLLRCPAAVRFLSCEPLLGPVDLRWLNAFPENAPNTASHPSGTTSQFSGLKRIHWVIVGGESGPGARPMHPDWPRMIRDHCHEAGVAFFFKQWGEWVPQIGAIDGASLNDYPEASRFEHREWDGEQWSESFWPDWVDFADGGIDVDHLVSRVGKRRAGRMLDGRTHDAMPTIGGAE